LRGDGETTEEGASGEVERALVSASPLNLLFKKPGAAGWWYVGYWLARAGMGYGWSLWRLEAVRVGRRKGAPGFDGIRLIGGIACASSWVFLPVFGSIGRRFRVPLEKRDLKRSGKGS
jgi:hypothetical protein